MKKHTQYFRAELHSIFKRPVLSSHYTAFGQSWGKVSHDFPTSPIILFWSVFLVLLIYQQWEKRELITMTKEIRVFESKLKMLFINRLGQKIQEISISGTKQSWGERTGSQEKRISNLKATRTQMGSWCVSEENCHFIYICLEEHAQFSSLMLQRQIRFPSY